MKVGEEIENRRREADDRRRRSRAWKCSASCWTACEAGDNVGCLLRGTKREDVERGQVLAKPGSITPHTKFTAEALHSDQGRGRTVTPRSSHNYRPQFYFRTTDVTGNGEAAGTAPKGDAGDNISMEVELIVPIAMDEGLRFAIREGGRTVGAGVVARSSPNQSEKNPIGSARGRCLS